jgi:hypothetical protein
MSLCLQPKGPQKPIRGGKVPAERTVNKIETPRIKIPNVKIQNIRIRIKRPHA